MMRNTCKTANTEHSGLIRHFWLEQMPSEVRAIIVGNKTNAVSPGNITLDDEATLADAIIETLDSKIQDGHQICQATTDDNIQVAIAALTQKVDELFHHKSAPQSRYRTRSRSASRTQQASSDYPGRSISRPTTCIFHRRFGMDARNCREPCNFHTSVQPKNE